MAQTAPQTTAATAAPAREPAAPARRRPAPKKAAPKKAAPKKAAATKPAAPAKKAASPAKPAGKAAEKSADKSALKLVRDGFTMPQQDFDLIAALKKRAIAMQRPAKKSELLRAGLHVLAKLPDEALLAELGALVQLKLGRPKKGD